MLIHRRDMAAALGALAALGRPPGADARPAWPDRPVRMVVPFAAGGVVDVAARLIAGPLGRRIGQPVVVENLPGAGSTIGARALARAAPDGCTLLLNRTAHPVDPALYPDAGFDSAADFVPVALVGDQALAVCVHPDVPAGDVPSLLAWLRARARQPAGLPARGRVTCSRVCGQPHTGLPKRG